MKLSRIATALMLSVVLIVGCVNVANLITLGTQIAINIIQIISAFQGHANAADIAAAQLVGNEASKDWNDVVNAYNAYNANKSSSNLQNVVNVGAILENDLTNALADAHIKDPILAGRIQIAVSTIITVVDSIAVDLGATIPVTPATAAAKAHLSHVISASPKAQRASIVNMWNNSVLAPTGAADVDAALAKSRL